MAILAAFNSPEIEVLGLTSMYGNVPTPMATRNALTLCHLAGRPEVRRRRGSPLALRRAHATCRRTAYPQLCIPVLRRPPRPPAAKQVPVVEGAHKSLRGAAKERIADFVHGADGFGNTHPKLAEVRWLERGLAEGGAGGVCGAFACRAEQSAACAIVCL